MFFTSGLFSVFAPLPLLLSFVDAPRAKWALLIFTNTAFAFLMGQLQPVDKHFQWQLGSAYLVLVVVPSLCMGVFLLRKKWSVEKTFLSSVGVFYGAILLVLGLFFLAGADPLAGLRNALDQQIQAQLSLSDSGGADWPVSPAEIKRRFLPEIAPKALMIYIFVTLFANMMLLFSINPAKIRDRLKIEETYFENWKAPELVIWPTIFVAAVALFYEPKFHFGLWVNGIAQVILTFLILVFCVHGLSVVAYHLEVWKVWRILRPMFYLFVIFALWPFLAGLGFFDLWFDFRAKLRHSSGPEK